MHSLQLGNIILRNANEIFTQPLLRYNQAANLLNTVRNEK